MPRRAKQGRRRARSRRPLILNTFVTFEKEGALGKKVNRRWLSLSGEDGSGRGGGGRRRRVFGVEGEEEEEECDDDVTAGSQEVQCHLFLREGPSMPDMDASMMRREGEAAGSSTAAAAAGGYVLLLLLLLVVALVAPRFDEAAVECAAAAVGIAPAAAAEAVATGGGPREDALELLRFILVTICRGFPWCNGWKRRQINQDKCQRSALGHRPYRAAL